MVFYRSGCVERIGIVLLQAERSDRLRFILHRGKIVRQCLKPVDIGCRKGFGHGDKGHVSGFGQDDLLQDRLEELYPP